MEESDCKVKIFSHDEVNHFRIINLLYKIAPSAVRVKFDREFHPSGGLERTLLADRFKVMEPLRKKKFINQTQWDLLYPKSGKLYMNGLKTQRKIVDMSQPIAISVIVCTNNIR